MGIQWTSREKKMLYVIIVLIIGLISVWYVGWNSSKETAGDLQLQNHLLNPDQSKQEESSLDPEESNIVQQENIVEVEQQVIVDVKGAVARPSIYTLAPTQRVHDAILMAGGLLEHASTKYINLAERLADGMVIYVPTEEEVEEMNGSMFSYSPDAGASSNDNSTSSGKININSASQSELETLPGIGPSRAQQIIAYREQQGAFRQLEDMMNISGIGPKIFEGLKDLIEI